MSIEVKVPVLPESVEDATVAAWHKQPGDTVYRDENLVDLETDKVVLEVPAPVDGVLKEIARPSGETVISDEVLAVIEEGAVEKKRSQGSPVTPRKLSPELRQSTPEADSRVDQEQQVNQPKRDHAGNVLYDMGR